MSSAANAPVPEPGPDTRRTALEQLLIETTSVTREQIERAHRINSRLREPRPILDVLVELGQLAQAQRDRVLSRFKAQLPLAEILVDEGAMGPDQLTTYRETRDSTPDRSEYDLLVGDGLVSEDQFLRALSAKHSIPFMLPELALIDETLLERISFPYLLRHTVLPFRMIDGKLTVIMQNPLDSALVSDMERIFDAEIRPCCAPGEAIKEAIRKAMNPKGGIHGEDETTTLKYREIREVEDGEEIGAEAVRIVDHVLYRAIEMGASDVHIEPRESEVSIRVRIDGVLQPLISIPADFAPRIAARVKVLCGVDLAERRRHQDGRIFVKVEGREVDMRVSTYASVFGETVVIRLLDRTRGLMPLDGLGFEDGILRMVREVVLRSSSGLILQTGPTGSGKTTTLYSFVDAVLDGRVKVITCEDPVEYVLDGATQCTIHRKAGRGYVESLRAMLRQDPDIIVVGEIRDQETARLAIESALTGHKVLSTFHTEDSVAAVIRLLEMGVEPFLVSSTLGCIMAQRLIRKLCPECCKEGRVSKRDLRYLDLTRDDLKGIPIRQAEGCDACRGTGYRGRIGIHEILVPGDDFRDAILRQASAKELRAMAKTLPAFMTLQEAGILKVASGLTSLSEIADHVPRDVVARSIAELAEIASRRSSS